MERHRVSGILLHPTSLPSAFGVGDLGPPAYEFVDFLCDTDQGLWQILPLGPTGYGNSPYMCFSAYGGNPILISLELLADEGLLEADALSEPPDFPAGRVDYQRVLDWKLPLLRRAFEAFHTQAEPGYPPRFYEFCAAHAFWLEDYALFMALKRAHGGKVWTQWEAGAAMRDADALVQWRNELADEINFRKFTQYIFFEQWNTLRQHCHERGIHLVGDIPIYVAHDSSDVWAHRELFHLDERGEPLVVAGVPPDYFSATGQRWGNPLYRWEVMAEQGFRWWIDRFRVNFQQVDTVRLDHFRGFEAFWEVPASESTAINGRWVQGPKDELFEALLREFGELNIIAEDLGVITPEVEALRDRFELPGMKILQMAFGNDRQAAQYLPHNYDRNAAVYTATHDHNTTVGWFTAEPGTQSTQTAEEIERERRDVLDYLGTSGEEIHWDLIRLAMSSVARLAVFPLQDILGLGTESRMNLPGSGARNWEWRFTFDMLDRPARDRLRSLTRIYERDAGRRVHAREHQAESREDENSF